MYKNSTLETRKLCKKKLKTENTWREVLCTSLCRLEHFNTVKMLILLKPI